MDVGIGEIIKFVLEWFMAFTNKKNVLKDFEFWTSMVDKIFIHILKRALCENSFRSL